MSSGTVFAGADIEATERAREAPAAVSALVAVGGAPARRQAGVHAGAARHRKARRTCDRPDAAAAFDEHCDAPRRDRNMPSDRCKCTAEASRAAASTVGLSAPRVHLEVRIPLQPIQRNQRRRDRARPGGPRRRGRPRLPRCARSMPRESGRPMRRRAAAARRSVPRAAYRHRYHRPSAVRRLRSHHAERRGRRRDDAEHRAVGQAVAIGRRAMTRRSAA